MNSNTVIKFLKRNGWFLKRIVGSHYHFKHTDIVGLITVPYHGSDDLHPATLHNILKVAQLSLNDYMQKKPKKNSFNKQLGVIDAITNSY